MSDTETFAFVNLQSTDRIRVTTNLNETIATVDDAATIRRVLAFLGQHQDGWSVPAMGVPIARLRLNFYAGDRPLGNLGVGKRFLSVHQAGSFWSKPTEETVAPAVLRLVGLEDRLNAL